MPPSTHQEILKTLAADFKYNRFEPTLANLVVQFAFAIRRSAQWPSCGFRLLFSFRPNRIDYRSVSCAAITAKGFEDIAKRLDVKDRVDALEKKMAKVETALNVRL
jgi:hypothetical protein